MMKTNWYFQLINLIFAMMFAVVSTTQLPVKSEPANKTRIRFIQQNLEKEPENRGAPRDRKGAGTRGDCPNVSKSITGLVPLVKTTSTQKQSTDTDSSASKFALGLTVSEYPTFWFYLPYASKDINSVKFVLLDEQKNYVTKEPITITVSGTPGIISVRLPQTEKPLEIGKYYHWYFLIDCNPKSRTEDIAVEGLVQRIEATPELQRLVKTAKPEELIRLYAQAGIWQDAVTLLAELRRSKPKDTALINDWKDLLKSVDLESIVTEPITPCCTP